VATRAFSLKQHLVADFLYDTDGADEQDLMDHAVQADDVLLSPEMEREESAPYRKFWRFPGDFQRTLIFQFTVPDDYTDTPVLRLLYDCVGDDLTGDVRVTVDVLANSDSEDMEAAEYDTTNVATDTVETAEGKTNLLEVSLSNADSAAAKDAVLVKLTRTPGHNDDTIAGTDVRVFEVDFVFNDA